MKQELGYFPYKLQTGMALTAQNKQARIQYADHCLAQLEIDSDYLRNIIYSDKCSFSLSGGVNKQTCRIGGSERPQEVYEVPQGAELLMVWCAISERDIIGPYFFEDRSINGERYKRMLRYFSYPSLPTTPETSNFNRMVHRRTMPFPSANIWIKSLERVGLGG